MYFFAFRKNFQKTLLAMLSKAETPMGPAKDLSFSHFSWYKETFTLT